MLTPILSRKEDTNKNTNGLIRRHLPKGTDFNEIDKNKRLFIQQKLNNRPPQIIDYKTPKEKFNEFIKSNSNIAFIN